MELTRILIWVKDSKLEKEIRSYSCIKASKTFKVTMEEGNYRMIRHEDIMKPSALLDFNNAYLNIWCYPEQLTEAEEILIEYSIKKLEKSKEFCYRQIEDFDKMKHTLLTSEGA